MVNIAVIGAGLMGAGIAELLARAGHSVAIWDADEAAARSAAERLPVSLRAARSALDAVADAAFVFEAIAEDEAAKRTLYEQISPAAPDAIFASNTSSILPSALASSVTTPGRFAVAHFFNPATVVPLVEIVPAPQTSPATLASLARLLTAAGKEAVVLTTETAGFIANRLQAAVLREAFALESAGIAGFADIDRVVRAGLGSRWAAAGPFSIVDLGGIDVWTAVTGRLFPDLAVDTQAPAALVDRLARGDLGAKTGLGIYPHQPADDDAVRARIAEHFGMEYP